MSEHSSRTVERHCDVCIVGGSESALIRALELASRGRAVIVVDPDEPRDSEAAAREQVRSHGGEIIAGRVWAVTQTAADEQRVELVGGHTIIAPSVLAEAVDVDIPQHDDKFEPPARSANQRDWDQRYSGRQMWSGNPNGTLVHEAGRLTPARALDVGAGEGGDAIWLAERGWQVVASDIAQPALDRVAAEAARRGLALEYLQADANADAPFEAGGFDLVSAQYASIPRRPDDRGVTNLLNAVAPGGVLLVVSHDLEPMRRPIDTSVESRIFDPDAYVRVEDFAASIANDDDWTIELNERRPRPAGAASGHHVDDVVFRARRG
jgi:SAM-dependent methyltransferase